MTYPMRPPGFKRLPAGRTWKCPLCKVRTTYKPCVKCAADKFKRAMKGGAS